jgi:hypothetical protein
MRPAGSVLVPYFGELFLAESRGKLDQCWPETAMHVRNLALNQFANEHVGTLANRLGSAKNLFPFWMAPPTAPDGTTSNRLREIWNRVPSRLGRRFRAVQQMRALPSGSQRSFGHLFSLTRIRLHLAILPRGKAIKRLHGRIVQNHSAFTAETSQ